MSNITGVVYLWIDPKGGLADGTSVTIYNIFSNKKRGLVSHRVLPKTGR